MVSSQLYLFSKYILLMFAIICLIGTVPTISASMTFLNLGENSLTGKNWNHILLLFYTVLRIYLCSVLCIYRFYSGQLYFSNRFNICEFWQKCFVW